VERSGRTWNLTGMDVSVESSWSVSTTVSSSVPRRDSNAFSRDARILQPDTPQRIMCSGRRKGDRGEGVRKRYRCPSPTANKRLPPNRIRLTNVLND